MKKFSIFILLITIIFSLTSCNLDDYLPKKTEEEKKEIIEEHEEVNLEAREDVVDLEAATMDKIQELYDEHNKSLYYYGFDGLFYRPIIYADGANDLKVGSAPMIAGAGELQAEADVSSSSSETSQTNVVVEGVDEGDTIKNDDRYLYYLMNNRINVIDSKTDEKAEYIVEGYPREMYLTEYGLTVITHANGYDTFIYVYDNKNPMDMKISRYIKLDKVTVQTSRVIDNKLYIKGNTRLFDKDKIVPICYYDNLQEKPLSYNSIYIDQSSKYFSNYSQSYFQIDLADSEKEILFKGFYGSYIYGDMHMTKNNIYIYSNSYFLSDNYTKIYRLSLDDFSIQGSLKQRGNIHDEYSIDEYNGVLRITTTYNYENNYLKTRNLLATYDITTEENTMLDSIEFADDERIYSAKFIKDKAYIVTYLYIDPLFEFDLSDPSDIKMQRELESPGVSDYLDYINEDFILGIGRITYEHGTYATSGGVKLSLFSLDNEEMIEEDTYVYQYEYSYTNATYNHKALIKLNESLCYYMPIEARDYKTTNKSFRYNWISGIAGFRVNLETRQIEDLGILESGSGSRAVVINGKLYAVGNSSVYVARANQNLDEYTEIK